MIAEEIVRQMSDAVATSDSGCALARVGTALGDERNMIAVGQRVGLTVSQAVGVMDGWDFVERGRMVFYGTRPKPDSGLEWRVTTWDEEHNETSSAPVDEAEWGEGRALGEQLCREAAARQVVKL